MKLLCSISIINEQRQQLFNTIIQNNYDFCSNIVLIIKCVKDHCFVVVFL